jgi:hypothetical protein
MGSKTTKNAAKLSKHEKTLTISEDEDDTRQIIFFFVSKS